MQSVCRAACAADDMDGVPADAVAEADAEASRWASIALVSQFSPGARQQLEALGLCSELLDLPQPILLPLLSDMIVARALARHPAVAALKPAEWIERELHTPGAVPLDSSTATAVDGMAALVIVARYQEHMGWLSKLPPQVGFHVLQKHALQPELPTSSQTLLPNVGRESHSYLTYLRTLRGLAAEGQAAIGNEQAVSTPPLLVCTQGDPFDHNPSFLDELTHLAASAARGHCDDFTPLGLWSGGERIIYCDASGAPHQSKLLPIARTWRVLFGPTRLLPRWLGFTPGAIFAVSREALLRTPMALLDKALGPEGGLCELTDPINGHVFERLWAYIFGDEAAVR